MNFFTFRKLLTYDTLFIKPGILAYFTLLELKRNELDSNWSLIYTSNKLYEAEILKQFLDDNGIDVFVINKQDSSYHIGDIEVYSRPDDVMKAKLLIEKFEN